jgi:beta-glucosidase
MAMSQIERYLDESLTFSERAADLVSRMTLEEKAGQMLFNAPAVPRLGIPFYNWWNEALHGVARAGVATMFPQAIGLAATFDEALIEKIADIISTEGRAKHHEATRKNDRGIYKGLTYWSPNVNIFRDPRWGRGHETYGEDPYLTARLGVGFIRGLQGKHPKYLKSAACAKHFAVHSGPEGERHSFNAVVSKKDLHETYLPAFRAAVTEAGVEAVMGAYNRTNDEPCCGSKLLLGDILRGHWQFGGHVTSDCWAIQDFHLHHHVTSTAPESAALAVRNGCDLNCGNLYGNLLIAVSEGLIAETDIDRSVNRLMTTRMRLGMFDHPEKVPFAGIPFEANDCGEHREAALQAARRSMVLLKNNGVLPLRSDGVRTIAVIGPNADSRRALIGNYYGTASRYVTVLEGIREVAGDDADILYAEGCPLFLEHAEGIARMLKEGPDRLAEAVSVMERSDVVILVLGLDETLEGEEGDQGNQHASGDKLTLDLPGLQPELLGRALDTGKPVVVVNISGSAMNLSVAQDRAAAVLQAWYPGAEGGLAVAEALFGQTNPSGRLPVTFYRSTDDLPDFHDYSMENRTYRYFQGEALYPFGYGLSYTTFAFDSIRASSPVISAGDAITVTAAVRNTGHVPGICTAQAYLSDLEASVTVPRWSLAGMKPVELDPGETCDVAFTLTARQMAVVDDEGRFVVEPGRFRLHVGGSQPDSRSLGLTSGNIVSLEFEVTGTMGLPV